MPKFMLEIDVPSDRAAAVERITSALTVAATTFARDSHNSGRLEDGDFDGAWSFENTEEEAFTGTAPCVHCGPGCEGHCSSAPNAFSTYQLRVRQANAQRRYL